MGEYSEVGSNVNIMVMGVGGGGNNAVNRMIADNVKNVEFVAVNTDKQALNASRATRKITIGEKLTRGFGAGADPNKGEQAAEESKETIKSTLKGVDLLFLTAGMGGGTGTGAVPLIASIAKEMGILTIAVVTKPFNFEGQRRMANACKGIDRLRKHVDTLLVIPNERLNKIMTNGTSFAEASRYADDVLKKGIAGISDLITKQMEINLDFADINTIMRDKGIAHMGVGEADGDGKMLKAVRQAVSSPLLETNIDGATGVILCFSGDKNMPLEEIGKATDLVRNAVDAEANIIFGLDIDKEVDEDKVRVILIATGFKEPVSEEEKIKSERVSAVKANESNQASQRPQQSEVSQPRSRYRFTDADDMRNRYEDDGLDIYFPTDQERNAPKDTGRLIPNDSDLPPFIRHLQEKKKK